MEAYLCCVWFCVLLLLSLPWVTATILIWLYAEIYDFSLTGDVDDQDTEIGRYLAIVQSASALIYLVYICLALIWLGLIGRPDDTCVHCCLVVGIPLFCVIPVVVSILILVSAIQNEVPIGQQIGIATAILCFISTSTCCVFLWWALCCGSLGKGRRSRYPVPFSYLPGLRSMTRREDEDRKETTSDYPPVYSSVVGGVDKTANGTVDSSKNADDDDDGESENASSDKKSKRSWFGRSNQS